ncbi:MAG: endolytic transglycosylase MltG [bacterium]
MKLIPYAARPKKGRWIPYVSPILVVLAAGAVLAGGIVLSLPSILEVSIRQQEAHSPSIPEQFPVTVNPRSKSIVENAQVNALFENPDSPLRAEAAAGGAADIFEHLFQAVAIAISDTPWYQSIAAADTRFVTITPGLRKEQVAASFGKALGWTAAGRSEFMTARKYSNLPLPEGSFAPGIYLVDAAATPSMAQALVNEKFNKDIVSRYGTTTAEIVPLDQALTIASLIERETGGLDDMRLISGIIWNRLFTGMNLQIDATLQYAKAKTANSWWPTVVPKDKYIKSPYNTYANRGLPPTPIASPSVAAVLAALNPVNTPCLFYFHDKYGDFHCSATYAEHVALLKKYYGQGK